MIGGDVTAGSNVQDGHPQAVDIYLAGNDGLLVVGAQFPGDRLPAVGTVVASHDGPIRLGAHVGTRLPGGQPDPDDRDGPGHDGSGRREPDDPDSSGKPRGKACA